MKTLDLITFILVIIGALNWGLIGLFHFNLVTSIFGAMPWLVRLIYLLVGLSAFYQAIAFKAIHQRWGPRASRTI
jgi:uncharacterized membrane protein YuzA (DUF378 family)